MRVPRFLRIAWLLLLISSILPWSMPASASAYNAHPRLVVIIVIDQFRGDYLERYRAEFGDGGFRVFFGSRRILHGL